MRGEKGASRNNEVVFDYALDDERMAQCWQACQQEYKDCTFSAGLVEGIDPDTFYLRLERTGDAPDDWMIFLRPDELLAIQWVIAGALWSDAMQELQSVRADQAG